MSLPKTATVTIGGHTFEREIEYGTAILSAGEDKPWDHDLLWISEDKYEPEEVWAAAQREFYSDPGTEGDRLVLVWRFSDRGRDSWFAAPDQAGSTGTGNQGERDLGSDDG